MPLSEFSLIESYFCQQKTQRSDVILGIGDDAALLATRANQALVVTMDTLVEGIHFLAGTNAKHLGYKALAVNLSDLAAMGAEPAWATLALTLPRVNELWLKDFSEGFNALAEQTKVQLVGGDTTRGPLTITVQVHGWVNERLALRRDAAKVGDLIYLTGTLGDAAAGLLAQKKNLVMDEECRNAVIARYVTPSPRLREAAVLRGIGHAAIDVSDGLLADLGHILTASNVGAKLEAKAIPLSSAYGALAKQLDAMPNPTHLATYPWQPHLSIAMTAGDDYELCFTVPPQKKQELEATVRQCDVAITQIGQIEALHGLRIAYDDHVIKVTPTGYHHF